MKNLIFTVLLSSLLIFTNAQEKSITKAIPLPSVDIKTVNGKSFNTKDIQNDGKPIIICFFATWCKPCMVELKSIAEVYDDWQDETGVKIYAVSIDDTRSSAKVLPLVNANDWDYEVLLDENQDFKRILNVNDIPHTFILNGNREIIWQHTSYAPGVEKEYIQVVKKILEEK
ncbi:MAG TPA: TlpA disulfide reductase family protein [Bacteroidales bacterium]|nr:TlpA disulfide reductase family protein [Bacteroidales bacterium]HON20285.1 TlpA disulfide reductase family protein [Bacteroidales bacterium]HOR81658.1 TlpA disulfide reductase family protein [Bacteroidales bacterium]HPJ90890.1 TlpA disulfide reductase family protein [Bacteroidales bacterium]HPX59339.1 TlpA disulfide reductase family protein [Bacteroidales bacterium]